MNTASDNSNRMSTPLVVGIIIAAVLVACLSTILMIWLYKRTRRSHNRRTNMSWLGLEPGESVYCVASSRL